MFQNYLVTAWRHLLKNRLFTAINVLGLAIGLMSCVLILLYVQDEFSYDTQWDNADRIYQANTTYTYPGTPAQVTSRVTGRMKEAMRLYFSEDIEAITRLNRIGTTVRVGGSVFKENVHWVDNELPDIFQLNVKAGNIQTALSNTSSLAISASFAEKYFGTTDPIGQTLELAVYDLDRTYTVAAVFEDLPHNTTLSFQALALIDEAAFLSAPWEFDGWDSANGWLYFKLKQGVNVNNIKSQLEKFVNTNVVIPTYVTTDKDAKATDFWNFSIQKLAEVQLNAISSSDQMKELGDSVKVISFSIVAGLILAIACINFINLSTISSTKRAKEIAVRKVLGAKRGQLMGQYFGESLLLVSAALLLGLVLLELVLPTFSGFLDKKLYIDYSNPTTLLQLLCLTIFVSLLAGAFPAFGLSKIIPSKVLKANKSNDLVQSSWVRQSLVVFQFAISIGLIVTTGVIYGQMQYSVTMDLGYNKDNLLSIQNIGEANVVPVQQTLKEEVSRIPGVTNVSLSATRPAGGGMNTRPIQLPGQAFEGLAFNVQTIDNEFIETYEIPIIAGRNFDPARSTDGTPSAANAKAGEVLSGTVIVNQSAIAKIGYGTPEQALGKSFRIGVGSADGQPIFADLEIIGIVQDMLFHRPRSNKWAEAYYLEPNSYKGGLAVRYSGDRDELVSKIRTIWQSLVPTVPFQYDFVDDTIASSFTTERHLAVLFAGFSLLAIIIACMGLYGLAAFTAEIRTKEIGVRKILGATVMDIVHLLVWQFSKPVFLACLVAWPIAVWAMTNWLETFPYHLDSWIFIPMCLGAGLMAMLIAWATVGSNTAKVARANPIKALRYE